MDLSWLCADCGDNLHPQASARRCTEGERYYMVTNGLWSFWGVGEGVLCVPCLETRMGRSLELADLTLCQANFTLVRERWVDLGLVDALDWLDREHQAIWKRAYLAGKGERRAHPHSDRSAPR